MSAIITGVLEAGYIVGLTMYVGFAFLKNGRVLDSVLTPSGMISKNYLWFGRQYQGEIGNRAVEVYFVPARVFRPTLLNIYVEANIGTRMAMGRQKPLLDCRDCERLVKIEPAGFQVYAQAKRDAGRLLSELASKEALIRLLDAQEAYGFREIYLQPERIWLHAHPQRMTAERFRQWLDDVLILAEASEKTLTTLPAKELKSEIPSLGASLGKK